MNTTQQIEFFKKQEASAKQMKDVALQNYQLAAQIESEAKSALALLGAKSGRTRKGIQLSPEAQLRIQSDLIK
ncbi:hypothetical protein [Flavobacterium sp. 25HG05S-40]|uniref:hypothetical protein n=1 Tax=Flavobacterium sp. 25HG05S-40 TaxID=3458682 RepID=UPI00404457B7